MADRWIFSPRFADSPRAHDGRSDWPTHGEARSALDAYCAANGLDPDDYAVKREPDPDPTIALLDAARGATRGRRRWGKQRDDGSIDFSSTGMTLFAEVKPDKWIAILWLHPQSGWSTLCADSELVERTSPDVVLAMAERIQALEVECQRLRLALTATSDNVAGKKE